MLDALLGPVTNVGDNPISDAVVYVTADPLSVYLNRASG